MRYSSFWGAFFCLTILSSCEHDDIQFDLKDVPSVVLHASYVGGMETRTSFGTFTSTGSFAEVQWNEKDAMSLFYRLESSASPKSVRLVTESSGLTADFSPTGEDADRISSEISAASEFLGLYPFDEDSEATFSPSLIKASVPSFQSAISNTFDPQAFLAVGSSSSPEQMMFYNVCGGFSFTLQDPSRYSSIEFYSNDGEPICGDIEISMSNPANPVARAIGTSQSKIILTPSDGTSFQAGVRYYISFLPGDFSSGFTMNFLDASGKTLVRSVCESRVSFRRGAFAYVSDADNPAKLAAIRDGILLSSDTEAANCYVVSAPGTYKFPLVRGINLDAVLADVNKVEVLWETANTISAPARGSIVSDVMINKKQVYFTIPDPMNNGNALIAAKSADDKILWSWHIWVCRGYDPESSSHLLEGKDKPMLDRNLGALATSPSDPLSNGLFYQWGRKDPFPGAAERYVQTSSGGTLFATTKGTLPVKSADVSVNVAYAIAHPTEYITSTDGHWLTVEDNTLWNSVKNDYDPCPVGWKVPSCYSYSISGGHNYAEEAWNNVPYTRYQDAAHGYGAYFSMANGGHSWYPNTGYISISGQLLMVGQYSIYWSCNPMGSNTFGLELSQNLRGEITLDPYQSGKYRGEGHAVRCIKDN